MWEVGAEIRVKLVQILVNRRCSCPGRSVASAVPTGLFTYMGLVMRVFIDGVEYAPVSLCNPSAEQIATALIERYMGKIKKGDWQRLANILQVCVSEDMNEPTVMETVSEILKTLEPI